VSTLDCRGRISEMGIAYRLGGRVQTGVFACRPAAPTPLLVPTSSASGMMQVALAPVEGGCEVELP